MSILTRNESRDLVPPDEIAAMLGLTAKTLENMRGRREGPPYVRVSNRAIRYSRHAVAAWLAERTVTPGARQT